MVPDFSLHHIQHIAGDVYYHYCRRYTLVVPTPTTYIRGCREKLVFLPELLLLLLVVVVMGCGL